MEVKKTYLSKGKLIISGKIVEVYDYKEKGVLIGYSRPPTSHKKGPKTEKNVESERISLSRARKGVRRLINANAEELVKFITLTFAENEQDVEYCNREFKKFVQRLKRFIIKQRPDMVLKYIAVIEFQKRGAVHYHMLTNVFYIRKDQLARIWGNGFVKVNKISHVDNVGAYVSKYMSKDKDVMGEDGKMVKCIGKDGRLWDKKMYFTSKNLVRPLEITEKEEVLAYKERMLAGQSPTYQNTFESDYLGLIEYKQYNLKVEY